MIAQRLTLLLVAATLSLCCGRKDVLAEDDPDVFMRSIGESSAPKYVWAIKQSRLSGLPRWDPAKSEVPVSPHQAVVAAIDYIHTRFGSLAKLRVIDISMFQQGLALNPVLPDVWTYTVSFDCDPEPPSDQRELLNVEVLMDGKVIVPVERPQRRDQ